MSVLAVTELAVSELAVSEGPGETLTVAFLAFLLTIR